MSTTDNLSPAWVAIAERLPDDGQTVRVRTQHGIERRATFVNAPPRWEEPMQTSQVTFYAYWQPLTPED